MTENSDKPVAVTLTCLCGAENTRGLPYDMAKPDSCDFCDCANFGYYSRLGQPTTITARPTSAGQSEEVVERVARAICTAEGFEPDRRNARGVINWVSYKPAASDALSALDLPTIQRDAQELKSLRKQVVEAEISLKAIGEPKPHDPPDAHICGVIARSALKRMADARALKEGTGE